MADVVFLDLFLSMLVLAFGIFSILAGAFTAYFGTGRSRSIGGGLIILGLVGVIILLWFSGLFGASSNPPIDWNSDLVIGGFLAVVGAIIGGLAALGIFLVAIMKS
ncbi:MAG: hypothetical protein QW379_00650 [Thermoplasmata archaeon]